MEFFRHLESAAWVKFYATSAILAPGIMALHYFTFFITVGTIVVVDLRLLEVVGTRRSLRQVADQIFPWMWTALVFAIITGFLLFNTEADDFAAASTFWAKLIVMVVGIVLAIVTQRRIPDWDQKPSVPLAAKAMALFSILLWLGVILVAAEIAAYNSV